MTYFAIRGEGVELEDQNVTIASSGTESTALDLQGMGLVGMLIPSAFTGASVTFKASIDGTNFYDIYNSDNTQFSITVGTSRWYNLDIRDFLGARYVKIVSASSEGAERTITCIMRSGQ